MNNLFFWSSWQKASRILYSLFLVLFVLVIVGYLYSQLFGKDLVLGWNIVSEVNPIRPVVDIFQKGFFEFVVDVPNQYLIQSYEGSSFPFQSVFSWAMLACTGVVLVTGSVAITYIKNIWYYLALLLIGLFIYFLHFDVLQVLNWSPMYWPVGVFLAFGVTIHFFHDYKPETSLMYRYLVVSALTFVVFLLSILLARVAEPVLHLAAYGWLAPFVLALVYIFMVSTEIYQAFLFVATDSKHAKPSSSLINLVLMSFIYLGNVILTFLKNRHSIDWELIYLEAPILLLLSSVLGIWGNKKKEPIYRFIADFSPSSAIWHLVMAINCFVCYAYVNQTGNDPLQEVFEDAVIFSQITTGIIFLLFIIVNFSGYMSLNLPVHAVVFQPKSMPFGFVRIISAIGILSIVLYNSDYQYRQAMSGYYTGIADVYAKQENGLLANEYYLSALEQDPGGHKVNYSLAMLTKQRGQDELLVKSYLKQASFKNATPQTYATLGYYLLDDGDIIRALETLREGKSKFPTSPEILNNLALAFGHTRIRDSTFHYLALAKKYTSGKPVAATNELAYQVKYNIGLDAQEVLKTEDYAYLANLLAFHNKKRERLEVSFNKALLQDSLLDTEQLAYVINLTSNSIRDTIGFQTSWLDSLAVKPGNERHNESLTLAKAIHNYYGGKVAEGIISLDQLQSTGSGPIFYNNLLSNWLLQQDAPQVAKDFLDKAKEAGDLNATFGRAIATSFYLPTNEAIAYWQDPALRGDSIFGKIAYQLQHVPNSVYSLGILPQSYSSASQLLLDFQRLAASNEKSKALGRVMNNLHARNEPILAIKLYKENEKTAQSEWEYLRALRKTLNREELRSLALQVKDSRTAYLQAWSLEESEPKEAERLYKSALMAAPLYEEGIIDALHFLKGKQKPEQLYDLLLQSVMLNQYSVELQKAYARQCIEMNLFGFADYSVNKLKDLMPKQEHAVFVAEMNKRKEEANNAIDWK